MRKRVCQSNPNCKYTRGTGCRVRGGKLREGPALPPGHLFMSFGPNMGLLKFGRADDNTYSLGKGLLENNCPDSSNEFLYCIPKQGTIIANKSGKANILCCDNPYTVKNVKKGKYHSNKYVVVPGLFDRKTYPELTLVDVNNLTNNPDKYTEIKKKEREQQNR